MSQIQVWEKGRPAFRSWRPVPHRWLLAGLVLWGACSSAAPHTVNRPTTTAAAPAAATTTAPAPATTVYQASAPQASLDKAGSHLLDAWRTGDRAGALTAAAPAAVDAVFGQPYPVGGLQPRGCAQAVAGPSSCTYRTKSGLLTLTVVAVDGGWIVETAVFE